MKNTNQNTMKIIKRRLWAGLVVRSLIVCLAVIGLAAIEILFEGSANKISLHENMPSAILVITMIYIATMFILWIFNYRQKFNKLNNIYNSGIPPLTVEEGLQRLKT